MIHLIFLLALLVVGILLWRESRRSSKITDAIEANRDLKTQLEIEAIEKENREITTKLTKQEK